MSAFTTVSNKRKIIKSHPITHQRLKLMLMPKPANKGSLNSHRVARTATRGENMDPAVIRKLVMSLSLTKCRIRPITTMIERAMLKKTPIFFMFIVFITLWI